MKIQIIIFDHGLIKSPFSLRKWTLKVALMMKKDFLTILQKIGLPLKRLLAIAPQGAYIFPLGLLVYGLQSPLTAAIFDPNNCVSSLDLTYLIN